jgi:hypothetical protein
MRRLHARDSSSRGVTVDIEGVTLGPNCVLVRRTPEGYRCISKEEASEIQALLGLASDPDWLFRQCGRIAKALADRDMALAQIYGMAIPIVNLTREQFSKLASLSCFIKANYNPDQPRDAHGRWTDGSNPIVSRQPSASPPTHSAGTSPLTRGSTEEAGTQLVADNQRENKMVRDIVVQLKLTRSQQQTLHRYISGQGYSYREVLEIAKEMFGN